MPNSDDTADKASHRPETQGWEPHSDDGFIGLIGPLWQRTENGRTRYGLLAEHKHHNRRGIVQGGVIATLADRAMGLTAWHANGKATQATIQLEVQYVGAAEIGDFIEADCDVVRVTRSLVFMRAEMKVHDRVVATANGIWKILDARPRSDQAGRAAGDPT